MTVENIGMPPWESEENKQLREFYREFAQNEIAPKVEEMEAREEIPRELLKQMADLNFFGIPFDEKYGGMGMGKIGVCIFAEELTAVHTALAVVYGAHVGLALQAVSDFGTEDQKQRFLVPGIKGEKIGALATTEPDAGSDIPEIKTRATRTDGGWILDGPKQFITNAEIADFIIVFAQTDPKDERVYDQTQPQRPKNKTIAAFIVDTKFTGVTITKREKKMGIHASRTNSFTLERVFVPGANLIGRPGDGLGIVLKVFNQSRITLTASCVGVARRAKEEAIKFASTRIIGGKPLIVHEWVRMEIAKMDMNESIMRNAVLLGAWEVDRGLDVMLTASRIKYFGPEIAQEIVNRSVQIHGGCGYIADFPIERLYRDIRVFSIFEGTSEVQLLTIYKVLEKQFMK